MNESTKEFFIYKYSHKVGEDVDLSFLPMMVRRKFSNLNKITLATLYECYEDNNVNLVFASQYGEFERLLKLIEQYKTENEVSPIAFSGSVHNASIALFSLLNKITTPYNAISASEKTLSAGLLDAIFSMDENNVLYCYADALENNQSVSCLMGFEARENAIKVKLSTRVNNVGVETPTYTDAKNSEFDEFVKFLAGETNKFETNYYQLERL